MAARGNPFPRSANALSRRRLLLGAAAVLAAPRVIIAAAPLVIDAAAFGVVGDGKSDATAGLNAASRSVPESGGTLRLPPGRFRLTSTVVLKSATTLTGPGATLFAGDEWREIPAPRSSVAAGYAMVTNAGHAGDEIVDRDITVADLGFEFVGEPHGNAHAVQFRKARNIVVDNCSFSSGGNGTAFLGCRSTLVSHCTSQGTLNCAYDHWEGTSDAIVRDSIAVCSRGYGILFTGEGTDPEDHGHAVSCSAISNRIFQPTEAGIWVCSLSRKSSVSDVTLRGNYVRLYTAGSGIGATGDIRNILMQDNIVQHARGGVALFSRPDKWNRPNNVRIVANQLNDCEVNEPNVALIQALGDHVTVHGNRANGGKYPALVWIDGVGDALSDNTGTGPAQPGKYNLTGARAPQITDP